MALEILSLLVSRPGLGPLKREADITWWMDRWMDRVSAFSIENSGKPSGFPGRR